MRKRNVAKQAPFRRQTAEEDSRSRVSQSDVPRYSLEEAMRVPAALFDNYAGAPTTPLKVAKAMNMSPTSSNFKMLCGASIAYGLTVGGYNASEIIAQPLSKRILRPTKEGDDAVARREAFLRPRVIGEFLKRYDNAPLPRPDIAQNVLTEMGVPPDRAASVLELINTTAEKLGLISIIKDRKYVDLSSLPDSPAGADGSATNGNGLEHSITGLNGPQGEEEEEDEENRPEIGDQHKRRRVFITHGKNQTFIDPIKKLLQFGELDAIVSVERQSVSQPVTDKVMNDMRACGAAIIHVDAEIKLIDQEAKEHIVLNPNVLIEIGAAMALYGRRFILLVRDGVKLPSNLQGLYEVRYEGETLDGNATIKLLEAINEMKKHPLLT